MRCRCRRLDLDRLGEAQSAAIAVPEAVDGVDEDAERRGLQAFRPDRPLLEWLPGPLGGKPGGGAGALCDWPVVAGGELVVEAVRSSRLRA